MGAATKVMVVEDERIVALNLQQRLIKLGYEVPFICANGNQALGAIKTSRPDIVLMDINIEGNIDGIETAAILAQSDATPVIFLTAYSEDATLFRAQATKPYGYLLKPFSERELHATIQMALARHKSHLQTQAELRTRTSDITQLQTRIEESNEQLALRELGARVVGELALAAESSATVDELITAVLPILANRGGWDWGAACAFKNFPHSDSKTVAMFSNGELTAPASELNDGNLISRALEILMNWQQPRWLTQHDISQIQRDGRDDLSARQGFWVPLINAGRLRSGLLFLQRSDHVNTQSWSYLFEHYLRNNLALFVERKQHQERLRQLSSAVEHSPVSVMITTAGGDIEYVNPQFTATTGYSSDEVLGKTPSILKSDNMGAEFYADMWRQLARGVTWRGEFNNRKKSGEEFWENAAIAAVSDPNGKITHYVAVKEDITERKQLDRELTAAKETAESANLAKSAFLANMSHEIRTPLNAILGLNFLLQKTPLSPMQADYVYKNETAAEFLLGILNDILDLSKIEAGKLDLESVDFNLEGLLQNVQTILQAKADEKHLQLVIDRAADVPANLCGDPLRLKQILINLGGNAIKFTDKGMVTIAVTLEEMSSVGPTLQFSVRDTGIGLSSAQQAILFEVFKQGDASTTRRFGGSGLGLAICRRLVEMMGGEIVVSSVPGRGSNFSCVIPFETAQDKPMVTAKDAGTTVDVELFKDRNVLLVEDNELNQQVGSAILNYLGVRNEIAVNGRKALDLIKEHGVDYYQLILMDIQMPEMDGFAATAAIRQLPGGALLPIVAMTADVLAEDRERCFAAGMDGYITKPIDISQLTDVLTRWLLNE